MIISQLKFTEDEFKLLLNLLNDELENQQNTVLEIQELKKHYKEVGLEWNKHEMQTHDSVRRKAENQIQIIWNTCKKVQALKQD